MVKRGSASSALARRMRLLSTIRAECAIYCAIYRVWQ